MLDLFLVIDPQAHKPFTVSYHMKQAGQMSHETCGYGLYCEGNGLIASNRLMHDIYKMGFLPGQSLSLSCKSGLFGNVSGS